MKMMESNFHYKGFTVYTKKDVGLWRAYSKLNIELNGKLSNVDIDETGRTEKEAADKARLEIDRQLNAYNQ